METKQRFNQHSRGSHRRRGEVPALETRLTGARNAVTSFLRRHEMASAVVLTAIYTLLGDVEVVASGSRFLAEHQLPVTLMIVPVAGALLIAMAFGLGSDLTVEALADRNGNSLERNLRVQRWLGRVLSSAIVVGIAVSLVGAVGLALGLPAEVPLVAGALTTGAALATFGAAKERADMRRREPLERRLHSL